MPLQPPLQLARLLAQALALLSQRMPWWAVRRRGATRSCCSRRSHLAARPWQVQALAAQPALPLMPLLLPLLLPLAIASVHVLELFLLLWLALLLDLPPQHCQWRGVSGRYRGAAGRQRQLLLHPPLFLTWFAH